MKIFIEDILRLLRILAIVSVLLSGYIDGFATNYYVSQSGDNSNSGTSSTYPIRTIDKVNTLKLYPGDSVLFNRGDLFNGMIIVKGSGSKTSPIVYGSYGVQSLPKPRIVNMVTLDAWKQEPNTGLWTTACPACGTRITDLWIQGKSQPLGRWPDYNGIDGGYNFCSAILSQGSSFTSKKVVPPSFVGAELILRTTYYKITANNKITAIQGNNISYVGTATGNNEFATGWGYFIQNLPDPKILNLSGEWAYDSNTNHVYLNWKQDPGISTISVAAESHYLFYDSACNYINVEGLDLANAETGVYLFGCHSIQISDCNIHDLGHDGIYFLATDSVSILSDTIRNLYGAAIMNKRSAHGSNISTSALIIRDNVISATGTVTGRDFVFINKGYNSLAESPSHGIAVESDYVEIAGNYLDSIGGSGITLATPFRPTQFLIKNNIIRRCLITISDNGGIYTYLNKAYGANVSSRRIENNIIGEIHSNMFGTPMANSGIDYSYGIYMDLGSDGMYIANNTVYDLTGYGMKIVAEVSNNQVVNVGHDTIVGNTFFRAVPMFGSSGQPKIDSSLIFKNIFFADSNLVVHYLFDYKAKQMSFDSNAYVSLYSTDNYIAAKFTPCNLSLWKNLSKKDINSVASPFSYNVKINTPESDWVRFLINSTGNPATYELDKGISFDDAFGTGYQGTLTLPPFSSKILLKKPSSPVLPVLNISLSGVNREDGIQLQWKLSGETDIYTYQVERSHDGETFNEIGRVNATGSGDYVLLDRQPAKGLNYYRVRAYNAIYGDILSRTVLFHWTNTSPLFKLGTYAYGRKLIIFANLPVEENLLYEIVDASGRTVSNGIIAAFSSETTVTLGKLSAGVYFLVLRSASGANLWHSGFTVL